MGGVKDYDKGNLIMEDIRLLIANRVKFTNIRRDLDDPKGIV